NFINASELTRGLMGSSAAANLFLLGFSYQKNLLPVSAAALLRAIELNKVEVAANIEAFKWGRHAAANFESVRKLAGIAAQPWQPLHDLDAIIDDRCARLVAYQDEDYARRYRELVEHVRRSEQAIIAPAQELRLTKTVARNLYKLMAYKDEYEVARLYSDGKFKAQLQENFTGNFTLQFHLAPPAFSKKANSAADGTSGRPPKYAMPGWFLTVFGQLAKLKFLRGTALDPFGYGRERRTERELIPRYTTTLQRLLEGLNAQNIELAIEIAALPQTIRGFGWVKAASIERATARQQSLLERFDAISTADAARIFYRAA
ncbi:MAG TPA: DUF6537 domain-containing protein, partial [Spongiibacteraceae bacterium]|nr:DUF6537 domain-containing protein [Spongiibacteraceae bacterium]